MEHERVQPVAPDPSSRLSRLCVSPPAEAKGNPATEPVDKSASKNPQMPKFIAEWVAAGISPGMRTWAREHRLEPWLQLHWDHFVDYISQPRQWKRYSDLDAAFRNAVRGDWGDVRMKAERAARVSGAPPQIILDPRPRACRYCKRPWVSGTGGIYVCASAECKARAERREPAGEKASA